MLKKTNVKAAEKIVQKILAIKKKLHFSNLQTKKYFITFQLWSWLMTNAILASEIKVLRRRKEVTMFYKFCNTPIRESICIIWLLLSIERSRLRWVGHVCRMPQ